MLKIFGLMAGSLLLSVTVPVIAAVTPSYIIKELGPDRPYLPYSAGSRAYGINNNRVVVGTSVYYGLYGMQWAPTTFTPARLGYSPDFTFNATQTVAVNGSGVMVGSGQRKSPTTAYPRGLLWTSVSATPTELRATPGDPTAEDEVHPVAINDGGVIVGSVQKIRAQGSDVRAVRWAADGTPIELPDLGTQYGIPLSRAYAVNNAGVVVGASIKNAADGLTPLGARAVRWGPDGGTPTDLGVLTLVSGRNAQSTAYDINDAGTVVGISSDDSSLGYVRTAAVKWDANDLQPTQLLGLAGVSAQKTFHVEAWAVNNAGDVVGDSSRYGDGGIDLGQHAVLWPAGSTSALDLNSLIAPSSGWTLLTASGINDGGDIVGTGLLDPDGAGGLSSVSRAFLMTRTPEPQVAGPLLTAVVMLLRPRRRSPGI